MSSTVLRLLSPYSNIVERSSGLFRYYCSSVSTLSQLRHAGQTKASNYDNKTTVVFLVSDRPGSLRKALSIFDEEHFNLSGIRSQASLPDDSANDRAFEITVNAEYVGSREVQGADCDHSPNNHKSALLSRVVQKLEDTGARVRYIMPSRSDEQGAVEKGGSCERPVPPLGAVSNAEVALSMPWFPRRISDLDRFASRCLQFGAELDADHPGFRDDAYRKRREVIANAAARYKHGDSLSDVDYTAAELDTWRTVYTELKTLRATHTSRRYQHSIQLLEREIGFGSYRIPQLSEVSRFLSECTGWTLRPVMGLLSSRDFLNGLAFRVFHSTQYVRHHSQPLYTPEPDVCHELLGHIPMLCDEAFSELNHLLGLASLGASDEDIVKLSRCYWFSVEFGLCREGPAEELRAYGAGLLSSFGELKYALSGKPQTLPWNAFEAAKREYPITDYQPSYFVARSIEDAIDQLRLFTESVEKPFELRFNPHNRSVSIIDDATQVAAFSNQLSNDLRTLARTLRRLGVSTS